MSGEKKEYTIQDILEDCKVLNLSFIDADFLPRTERIGSLADMDTFLPGDEPSRIVWFRPFAPSSKCEQFCRSNIQISQSKLFLEANSPLWTVLNLLATNHACLLRLFENNVLNDRGVYCINLHVDGQPTQVIIDDVLPCDAETGLPIINACSACADPWPSLVEKALAKVHGSFAAVYALSLTTLLEEIFGCPISSHKATAMPPADIYNACKTSLDRGALVFAATKPGLLEEHTVLLCAVTATAELNGEQLMRMTATTGGVTVPWQSQWAPGGQLCSEKNLALLKGFVKHDSTITQDEIEEEEERSVWLASTDFSKHFDVVSCVHSDREWFFVNIDTSFTAVQNVYAIEISETADIIFTTKQNPTNTVGTRLCIVGSERPYIPYGGGKEAFVASSLNGTERVTLPAGTFFVMVEVYGQHASRLPADVTISLASTSNTVEVSGVTYDDGKGPEWSFVLPEFIKKNGACAACKQALSGAIFTLQGNLRYHSFCFVCTQCGEALGTQIFMCDGNLVCGNCVKK